MHHAAVRGRRLAIAVNQSEVEALIAAIASLALPEETKSRERTESSLLLRYLESVADRFGESEASREN